MKFNDIEKEVIFLKAILELIDNMVNRVMLKVLENGTDSEVRFKSSVHLQYFNVILVDFLSCSDKDILGEQLSYLGALKSICNSPSFNKNNSIVALTLSTKNFVEWLEKEIKVEKIWFPSIELQTDLNVKRIEFIKICGNISKHNFTRLSGVVHELVAIFKRNKINLKEEDSLLILNEFYEWFHEDIFTYHSSAIAEFLNNIRLGIYEYLVPEFVQSIVYEGTKQPQKYHYTYPKEMTKDFAKICYWDLMDEVCSGPCMNKFEVTRYLKMRY